MLRAEVLRMAWTVQWIAEQHQRGIIHLGGGHARHPTAIGMTAGDRTGRHLLDKHRDGPLGFTNGKVDGPGPQLALFERLHVRPHAAGVTRGSLRHKDGWPSGRSRWHPLTLVPNSWHTSCWSRMSLTS